MYYILHNVFIIFKAIKVQTLTPTIFLNVVSEFEKGVQKLYIFNNVIHRLFWRGQRQISWR